MTITELEKAITQLSPEDFSQLLDWLEEFEADQWDKQIERDAASGKLDKLVEQAMKDYEAGKAREL
jgi:hypothetical protein